MAAIERILSLIGRPSKFTCKENLGPPKDCDDIPDDCPSGVYTIFPDTTSRFKTYCEMDVDGGHWTVFHRRNNGYTHFYRGWVDYQNGFGNIITEFWLGNQKLYKLTSQGKYQLRIDLSDFDGNSGAFAKYDEFSISDNKTKVKLTANGYYGTAGDSLVHHNGHQFSTKDADNDRHPGNCAESTKGAWWYNYCATSNLNGEYFIKEPPKNRGIFRRSWKGYNYSVETSVVMIRKV